MFGLIQRGGAVVVWMLENVQQATLRSQEKLPLYLGFFQLVHNVRIRGKGLLSPLLTLLVA